MRKTSILVIFLTVFVDLVGFGIVLPMLPTYADEFGASGWLNGLIVASYSFAQFIFAPIWGRWSDRIGRRPIILMSLFGSSCSYGLFAYASTMEGGQALMWLFVSRFFAGVCGANLSVASAYIADITEPEKRSKRMGLIGMAFGLGFIFGPAIGGASIKLMGATGPGIFAASICFLNFLMAIFFLGESWKPDNSVSADRTPRLEQWRKVLRRPKIGLLIGLFFLATFCFSCFESSYPLVLKKAVGYGPGDIAFLFSYCGLLGAFIQGGLVGRLVKKFGETNLIFLSLVILAVGMVVLPIASSKMAILGGLAIFALGSGLNRPPTFGLLSLKTPKDEQGVTMGVAQSAGSLARMVGPLFALGLSDYSQRLPYFVCAGVAVVAAVIAYGKLRGSEDTANPVDGDAVTDEAG